ncbi:MAG: hypothetical protein IT288_14545 [Bdellovibrionales bacterium]|nr:hypothetical protein [Bdellovibrionales bacterium]
MINIDDLKDKATESLNRLKETIQESSVYNTLRERYETLPAATQKAVVMGSAGLVVMILLSIPWSFLSSSSDFVSQFEESRDLIRGLLKTRSMAKGTPLPRGMSAGEIESRARTMLTSAGLLESQIGSTLPLPQGDPQSGLAPSSVLQQGVRVELKQLNLRQIIDVGYELQNLDPSVKMTGLEIQATAEDPHYFTVAFKLISFSLPEPEENPEAKEPPARGKKGLRGK